MQSEKFKNQNSETILSLQYSKFATEEKESAEEWMDYLRIKANKCGHKERDKKLKEQFINGINDDDLMMKITRELTVIKKTNEITSKQVLSWA